jgi:hypothetical protein
MANFFQRLLLLFRQGKTRPASPEISAKLVKTIAVMVDHTEDVECDCNELIRVMDQFAELDVRGEDAAVLMPLAQHHLEICGDCREEYEALVRVLRAASSD